MTILACLRGSPVYRYAVGLHMSVTCLVGHDTLRISELVVDVDLLTIPRGFKPTIG